VLGRLEGDVAALNPLGWYPDDVSRCFHAAKIARRITTTIF
jgi:hypothetical protein